MVVRIETGSSSAIGGSETDQAEQKVGSTRWAGAGQAGAGAGREAAGGVWKLGVMAGAVLGRCQRHRRSITSQTLQVCLI